MRNMKDGNKERKERPSVGTIKPNLPVWEEVGDVRAGMGAGRSQGVTAASLLPWRQNVGCLNVFNCPCLSDGYHPSTMLSPRPPRRLGGSGVS